MLVSLKEEAIPLLSVWRSSGWTLDKEIATNKTKEYIKLKAKCINLRIYMYMNIKSIDLILYLQF